MRYYPAALALSLLVGVTASVGVAEPAQLDSRAADLVAQGRASMAAGNVQGAIGAFESALAIDPGQPQIYLDLAGAARREGLQGKAIHYYRQVQSLQPGNLSAISGEGEALVEKGAVEKAKRNLTKLESMCGDNCAQTKDLAAAIAKGPVPKVLTAEAVAPAPSVTQN